MIVFLALLACVTLSSEATTVEATQEIVPITTAEPAAPAAEIIPAAPAAEIITEPTSETTIPTKIQTCSSIILNTWCSANSTGSTCEVGCLDGQETSTYVCDSEIHEWTPEVLGEECPVDVLQWQMYDLYCKDKVLDLEPEMSAYQCADKVASNPDCLTNIFSYIPLQMCKCVTNVKGCRLEYTEPLPEPQPGQDMVEIAALKIKHAVGAPSFITINATDMYVPLTTDQTCGEKQDAVQYCKECEWEEIISLEECAGQVLESTVCSPIFSWLNERNPEKNQCWCVPKETTGCDFEKGADYVTYTLTQHRNLLGEPPQSSLKTFTLKMIIVIMVTTPIALCAGFSMHTLSSRRKGSDFGDVLLDGKYDP